MRIALSLVLLIGCAATLAGQQRSSEPDTAKQAAAMKKLSFLVGRWSGPATISRGPGEPLHVTQTEEVQYKLDGLLLLVEGTSRDAEGKVVFQAMATISVDEASGGYRFRAYNGGRYLDTALTLPGEGAAQGFLWSYDAGPAHVTNTMRLTDKGEWSETTAAAVGGSPARPSVEMLLSHPR